MTRQRSSDLSDSKTVSIRFPSKLYDWLKNRSDKERRSFNAQVILELDKLMESENNDTPPTVTIG